jgi:AraC-like DNA-binding protein
MGRWTGAETGPKRPLPAPPWLQCRGFRGLADLRRLLGNAHASILLTAGARLAGSFFQLALDGDVLLTGGTLDAPTRSTGLIAKDTITAIVVLDGGKGGGHINGAAITDGAFLLFRPGSVYDGWSPAGYRWVAIHVRRDAALALARSDREPLRALKSARVARAQVAAADLEWGRDSAERAGLFKPTRGAVAVPADRAEDLRAGWTRVFASGWRRAAVRSATRADLRNERVLRTADGWLRDHLAEPLYVADLCREAGVPERTLHHVFRARFGLRPMEYVASVRLVKARRALIDGADANEGGVTRVARSVGFEHMGRFAAAYRRAFGESPRETVLASRREPSVARVVDLVATADAEARSVRRERVRT